MWRLLQLVIIFGTVWFFDDIEPTPHAALGHKVLFGFILAFVVTWVLSKLIDLLRFIFWRINKRTKRLP